MIYLTVFFTFNLLNKYQKPLILDYVILYEQYNCSSMSLLSRIILHNYIMISYSPFKIIQ